MIKSNIWTMVTKMKQLDEIIRKTSFVQVPRAFYVKGLIAIILLPNDKNRSSVK